MMRRINGRRDAVHRGACIQVFANLRGDIALLFVPDHINSFVLDFEVGAAEEFPEQAHHQQLHAQDDEENGEQEERAIADVDAGEKFEQRQVEADEKARAAANEAGEAKKLHRLGKIVEQEGDGQQVEHDAHGFGEVVLGFAIATRAVVDGHFGHAYAHLGG